MRFAGRIGIFVIVAHVLLTGMVAFCFILIFTNAGFRQEIPDWLFAMFIVCGSFFALLIPFNLLTYFRQYLEFGETSLLYNAGLIRRSYRYDTIIFVTRFTQTAKPNRFVRGFANLLGFNIFGEVEMNGKTKEFLLSVKNPDEFIVALEKRLNPYK